MPNPLNSTSTWARVLATQDHKARAPRRKPAALVAKCKELAGKARLEYGERKDLVNAYGNELIRLAIADAEHRLKEAEQA